jgi:hypothetical protein
MKVSRQNISERYNITSDWVSDFANNIDKKSDYMDNLRVMVGQGREFSTIEEKMADIRDRSGFGIVKDVGINTSEKKTASCCDSCNCSVESGSAESCGSLGCKPCKGRLVSKIRGLIDYLGERQKHRPELGVDNILSHCRENSDLNFHEIESKVDSGMLRGLLTDVLKLEKKDTKEVKYTPEDCETSDNADDMADYMRHAQTSG